MSRRITGLGAVAVVVALGFFTALGCGSDEDPMAAAKDAAKDASDSAGAAAQKMGEAAGGSALDDVAAGAESAAARCLSLAAKKQWSDALSPCTEAANANPDDLRIKHAVQQAQAAASEG
jgi:hypothetical protein